MDSTRHRVCNSRCHTRSTFIRHFEKSESVVVQGRGNSEIGSVRRSDNTKAMALIGIDGSMEKLSHSFEHHAIKGNVYVLFYVHHIFKCIRNITC